MLTSWEKLPESIRIPEVRPYYDILNKKRFSLLIKRLFDLFASIVLLILLAVPMIVIAVWIKTDSEGPVFYRQERVTRDGKHFRIHKFRTMVVNADRIGTAVTVGNDKRITNAGEKLRNLRLDELPQLLDVLKSRNTMRRFSSRQGSPARPASAIRMRTDCSARRTMLTARISNRSFPTR